MTKDELIGQLQASEAPGNTPVVALTGDPSIADHTVDGYTIAGVTMYRGALCVIEEGYVNDWPEPDADELGDDDEDDDA